MITAVVSGEDYISLSGLVRFVKLAYNLESLEVFDILIGPAVDILRGKREADKYKVHLKTLELLQALSPLNPGRMKKRVTLGLEDKDAVADGLGTKPSTGESQYLILQHRL